MVKRIVLFINLFATVISSFADDNIAYYITIDSCIQNFDEKRIFITDIETDKEYSITLEKDLLSLHDISDFYWDPFLKESYIYIKEPLENRGWYKLSFDMNHNNVELEFCWDGFYIHSPSKVIAINQGIHNLSFNKILSSDNKIIGYQNIITDNSSEIIWQKRYLKEQKAHALYNITGPWMLQVKSYYLASPHARNLNIDYIFNYINNEIIYFQSEIIIGYGDSRIITTNEDFHGVKIYKIDEKKHLLHEIEEIDILEITKDETFAPLGGHIICSYCDDKTVFISIKDYGYNCAETSVVIDIETEAYKVNDWRNGKIIGFLK